MTRDRREVPPAVVWRARDGDEEAFREVVEAYAGPMYNLAYRMVYNENEARDLSQEIFLRLFRNFGRYDPAYPFGPWFYRLATNCCINWKRGRRTKVVSLDRRGDDEDHGLQVEDESSPSPSETAISEETGNRLRKAIEELPPDARAVVALRYLEGWSCEEIGRRLDLPVGTVKVRLFRARERLRERLAPAIEEREP